MTAARIGLLAVTALCAASLTIAGCVRIYPKPPKYTGYTIEELSHEHQ